MNMHLGTCVAAAFTMQMIAALAEDSFQRLRGSQIQAKFTGMEMTDEVHWSEVYRRDGTLITYEMGGKRSGKWWVQKDELCQDRGKDLKACYEVWISGRKVELRAGGSSMPLEGMLGPPIRHQ
jgi:hypothetical protein